MSPTFVQGVGRLQRLTHRYARCSWVNDAWEMVREVITRMEPELEQVSNKRMIHLGFQKTRRDVDIMWVLGVYLEFVEEEVVIMGRRVKREIMLGHLKYQRQACKHLAMPGVDQIPAVDQDDVPGIVHP